MLIRTLGIIERDGLNWAVEEHDEGEIRITCAEMCAARVRMGPGGILGQIEAEPEWADPAERMELLRQDMVDVLIAEGRADRGPWAGTVECV